MPGLQLTDGKKEERKEGKVLRVLPSGLSNVEDIEEEKENIKSQLSDPGFQLACSRFHR